jgi:TonB family protein
MLFSLMLSVFSQADSDAVSSALSAQQTIAVPAVRKGPPPVRVDDYPAEAIRKKEAGYVIVRFRIDPDGRVRHCETAKSSGSSALDAVSCAVMPRFRFAPARDAAGSAIAEVREQHFSWALSRQMACYSLKPGVWPEPEHDKICVTYSSR